MLSSRVKKILLVNDDLNCESSDFFVVVIPRVKKKQHAVRLYKPT